MQPNLFHQELARMRYAEALREASLRHDNVRREPAARAVPGTRRARFLRRLRPVFGS